MNFAIQTVFLPRENILFLHEWLEYHMKKGCEHFYLYDNSGSLEGFEAHHGFNRNEVDVETATKHLSDSAIADRLATLCSWYPITLIPWKTGRRYQQALAASEALRDYGHGGRCPPRHAWMAFIDIDEFIVGNLDRLDKEFAVMLRQRKFPCRWGRKGPVTKAPMQMDVYPSETWAPKWMLRPGRVFGDFANIHHPPPFPACPSVDAFVNKSDVFIHHYNTNQTVLNWWHDNWKTHDADYKGSFDVATAFTVPNEILVSFSEYFGEHHPS